MEEGLCQTDGNTAFKNPRQVNNSSHERHQEEKHHKEAEEG